MKFDFPKFENFYIKEFTDDDLDLIYKLRSNKEVQKHHPDGVFSKIKAKNYFEGLNYHYQKHGFSYLPVFEKVSDNFVGICGLMFFDPEKENFINGEVEIGYAIMPEFWGKGIATILSEGFCKWGFKNLPINKIIAVCNPVNVGSVKVIKKIGGKYVKTVINPRVGDEVEMYEILRMNNTR